jgi:hypothetical protein
LTVSDGGEVLEAPCGNYCHPTLQVTINSILFENDLSRSLLHQAKI